MAAVAESASTYGHYVLLQPEEHRDDNCEDDDDFVGNLFTMGQIICVVLTLCLGFVHIILPFIIPADPQISVRITGVGGRWKISAGQRSRPSSTSPSASTTAAARSQPAGRTAS